MFSIKATTVRPAARQQGVRASHLQGPSGSCTGAGACRPGRLGRPLPQLGSGAGAGRPAHERRQRPAGAVTTRLCAVLIKAWHGVFLDKQDRRLHGTTPPAWLGVLDCLAFCRA